MSKTKKRNQRPKELSELVFWLPSKFGDSLAGGDDAYLRKIRKLEKPVINIDTWKGKYPYYVELDVVEGFSDNCIDLTPETITQIRQAFKAKKFGRKGSDELDIAERFFICNYETLEDAVTVANLLANINYEFTFWEKK